MLTIQVNALTHGPTASKYLEICIAQTCMWNFKDKCPNFYINLGYCEYITITEDKGLISFNKIISDRDHITILQFDF